MTATFTGATNITTAAGVNFIDIEIPTYTNSSAMTVTNAATLTIKGAPATGGSLAITNAYALWTQAGAVRFDGVVNVQATIQGISGANTLNLKDTPGGTTVLQLNGGVVTVTGSVVPVADATYTLGTAADSWASLTTQQVSGNGSALILADEASGTHTNIVLSSTQVTVKGSIIPSATATYNIGSSSEAYSEAFVNTVNAQTTTLSFRTGGTESFNIVNASHLIQITTGLTPGGSNTVVMSNAPTGVSASPLEYWEVLGTGAGVRYIALLGNGG